MIFAKLDVCIWGHEKFVSAGPAAVGLWAAALAYLRDHTSSDGLLKAHILGLLLGLGERDARKLADKLVSVGLFAAKDRDYILLGYASKNETREQIEARRASTAQRVADHRRKRAGNTIGNDHGNADCNSECNALHGVLVPGSGSPSGSGSDLPRETGSDRRLRVTDDGAFGLNVTAWADGVRSVTGMPFLLPTPGSNELSKLVLGLRGLTTKDASELGVAFAKARAGEKLNAHAFIDWLNSGKPERGARFQKPEPEKPKPIVVTPERAAEQEREYQAWKARQANG